MTNMQRDCISDSLLKMPIGSCGVRWDCVVWRRTDRSWDVDGTTDCDMAEAIDRLWGV